MLSRFGLLVGFAGSGLILGVCWMRIVGIGFAAWSWQSGAKFHSTFEIKNSDTIGFMEIWDMSQSSDR